jgi:photosystem II stability/assembly factor-like uncharacterized protein
MKKFYQSNEASYPLVSQFLTQTIHGLLLILLAMMLPMLMKAQSAVWEPVVTGLSDTLGGSVKMLNKDVIWTISTKGTDPQLYYGRTSDGGATWTTGEIPLGIFNGAFFISELEVTDPLTAYLSGISDTPKTIKTTDGGLTWTELNVGWSAAAFSFPDVIHAFSANELFVMGDPIDGEFEIYNSVDAGVTWTRVDSANIPDPEPGEYGFIGVVDVVGNEIWFGTSTGRVYHSADKGYTWNVYDTPSNFCGLISFSDAQHGIVEGGNYDSNNPPLVCHIYRTADGGATWEETAVPGDINYTPSILEYVPNTSNILLTITRGTFNDGPYETWISPDDGDSWTQIPGDNAGIFYLNFSFLDNNTGWAGGQDLPSHELRLYKYHPSTPWEPHVTGITDTLGGGVKMLTEDIIWTISPKNADPQLYYGRTSDGGATWTTGEIPLEVFNGVFFISELEVTDSLTAYLSGISDTPKTVKTTDGGLTWTELNVGWSAAAFSFPDVIHAFNADELFVMGDPIDGEFEIYNSVDAGATWTRVDGANIPDPEPGEYGFIGVVDVIGDEIWFGTSTGRVYHSADKGYTWNVYDTPSNFCGLISFSDAQHGIVEGGNYDANVPPLICHIYRTADGGATWEETAIPGDINYTPSVMEYIPNSTQILLHITRGNFDNGPYETWVSPDRGDSWHQVPNNDEAIFYLNFSFLDDHTGWGGGRELPGQEFRMFKYTGERLCTPTSWYADNDGDGYGAGTAILACEAPAGTVADNTDCDDDDATVYPGAPELCDGIDNNCDLIVDNVLICPTPTGVAVSNLTMTTATVSWDALPCAVNGYQYKIKYNTGNGWSFFAFLTSVESNSIDLSGLFPGTTYYFKVRTVCYGSRLRSPEFDELYFTTPGTALTDNEGYEMPGEVNPEAASDFDIGLFPNPSNGLINAAIDAETGGIEMELKVTDNLNKVLKQYHLVLEKGMNHQEIDLTGLPAGIYTVLVCTQEGVAGYKVVKQ